jgi:pyruvate,orthophosphate dikinase
MAVVDGVRRLLIINDNWPGSTDDMFRNSGVHTEVKLVRTIDDAISQLNDWAARGQRADIITIDYHRTVGEDDYSLVFVARHYQEQIVAWSAKQPQEIKPQKLFWHSCYPNKPPPGNVGLHYERELGFIDDIGANQFDSGVPSEDMSLCNYINQEWGTELPTNDEQLRLLAIQMGSLSPYNLPERVEKGEFTEIDALRGVDESFFSLDSKLDTSNSAWKNERFDSHCDGAATGVLAFDAQDIKTLRAQGKPVILVVEKLEPKQMSLVPELAGFVALRGDTQTQHAKHIFEAHGIPALFGDKNNVFNITSDSEGRLTLHRREGEDADQSAYALAVGDAVSIGDEGLFPEALPVQARELHPHEKTLAQWAGKLHRYHGGMAVKANADTPEQVKSAMEHGAAGIGLVRTEHMFFSEDCLQALQDILRSPNADTIKRFRDVQQAQFEKLLRAAQGSQLPITIRLLDAPPDEFLSPQELDLFLKRVQAENARGARLALKTEGLYAAQMQALIEAAQAVQFDGSLEVMIPLVHSAQDLRTLKAECQPFLDSYAGDASSSTIRFGAMIETLSAVADATEIAKLCDFVSFGTNDLTAEIVGSTRQDLLATQRWMRQNQCDTSPYRCLAPQVFAVIEQALQTMKTAQPSLEVRICGDQVSGDFRSIKLCSLAGFESISVRPTAKILTVSRILVGKLRAASSH